MTDEQNERAARVWRAALEAGQQDWPKPIDDRAATAVIAREFEALEAEVKRLRELVEAGRLAIGDHFAPNDCYATGPLTGNSYRDLVVCPACSFLTDYDAMKARAALGASHD